MISHDADDEEHVMKTYVAGNNEWWMHGINNYSQQPSRQ